MRRTKSMILTVCVLSVGLALGLGCGGDEGLKVTKVEPKEGPFGGGDPVRIHGSGFQSSGTRKVDVYFGGNKAQVLEIESGLIVVRPPGGKVGEKVDVQLVFEDSRRIKIDEAYKYIDPAPLKVDDLEKKDDLEE